MDTIKIRQGKALSLLIITLLIVFNGCEKKKIADYSKLNSTDLLMEAYKNKDNDTIFSKICILLDDSIKKDDMFIIATFVNETDKTIGFSFVKNYETIPEINERLMFDIYIENGNNIYANNKKVELSEIGSLAYNYTFNPEPEFYRMLKKTIKSSDFGEVETFSGGINLVLNANNNKKISTKEWKLLFDCLHKMLNMFDRERNNFALSKLGKKYDDLSFEQKSSITNIIGYAIIILSDDSNIWGSSLSN
jgi:hypothetical protein